MSTSPTGVAGITEDDIAGYLANTPAFFERYAPLLSTVQLVSPHGARAVSLQERQIELLRDRIRGMERKFMELIRAGQDNEALSGRLHRWTCTMLLAREAPAIETALIDGLKNEFLVPQVALRVWGLAPEHQGLVLSQAVSDDAKALATSLTMPYCGLNSGFEAASWFEPGVPVQSMALLPLRVGKTAAQCFGLLALGSPDALRYQSDMGVELLEQIGDIASAALARLLP
ncbi:MAG: DUF484 domain-containing protein [Ideonella sp. MAG2]|nr:MAG: DUF484 domain-containing protein [Ideonella sp. MAG2]